VESFGALEAPSLLPHAVAAFFAQGGRRAYVIRIVHAEPGVGAGLVPPPGCPHLELAGPDGRPLPDLAGGPLRFRARNEGTWGNRLRLLLSFPARPPAAGPVTPAVLRLDPGTRAHAGTV